MGILDKIVPSCREAARLCSESLERRLSVRERALLWLHGRVCYYCTRYSSQIRWVHTSCRAEDRYEHREGQECLPEERKDKLKALLQQQAEGKKD